MYIVTYKPYGSHRPKIYNRYTRTKRKESKYNTTVIREEKNYKNYQKMMNKMAISTYLSIITL